VNRIEYVRLNTRRHREGETPLSEEFGILPRAEMLRILAKYPPRPRRGARKKGDTSVCLKNIAVAASISPTDLKAYIEGGALPERDGKANLGRLRLRKLSRILTMLENGRMELRNCKLVALSDEEVAESVPAGSTPAAPPPPRHVIRLRLDEDTGRPIISVGGPPAAPRTMPSWFAGFASFPPLPRRP